MRLPGGVPRACNLWWNIRERRCEFWRYFACILSCDYFFEEPGMTIKVGDTMPAGKLWELPVEWFAGCPTAADEITLPDAFKGKRIVLFGLPGAYTRT
jgi:hypothetical protein